MHQRFLIAGLGALALASCANTAGETRSASTATPAVTANPYPSTYRAYPGRPVALVGATVFDGTGKRIEGGTVLLRDGKVVAVGDGSLGTDGYDRVDAASKFVTPGVIDIHSHLGVYPSPSVQAHSDGNEAPSTTPRLGGAFGLAADPGFSRALAMAA